MGKKGKKGKKNGGGDGDDAPLSRDAPARPGEPLSVGESILSFQIEVKTKTIQAFKEEIVQLIAENETSKENTLKLQSEQLSYVKQSMKSAKDFDVDYQTTLSDLQMKLEEALKEKQSISVALQKEEDGMKEECQKGQEKIDAVLTDKAELLDYKDNGSVLHNKNIEILRCTIHDINSSFDENSEYIEKNLRLTLDEISKDTASKVDSQKYQATDRAIQLLDPRNYTVAQQNSWLKGEVQLLRDDIERLWSEVEKLETENIYMLTDMYDERMLDITRSRQHYMECVKKGTTFGNRAALPITPAQEESEESEDSDSGDEIGLTDAELQLLTIQGHHKPLNQPPPGTEEESALLAVSSFEWTLHDKNPVSLTTL